MPPGALKCLEVFCWVHFLALSGGRFAVPCARGERRDDRLEGSLEHLSERQCKSTCRLARCASEAGAFFSFTLHLNRRQTDAHQLEIFSR